MRPTEAAALALLVVLLAASAALAYSSYFAWSSASSRVVETYSFPSSSPVQQAQGIYSAVEAVSEIKQAVESGLSPSAVNSIASATASSPLLQRLGLAYVIVDVNRSYFELRDSYHLALAAQALESNGSLAEAAVYANESLSLLREVNATLNYLLSQLPNYYNILGQSGVQTVLSLLNRTLLVMDLINSTDEAVLRIAEVRGATSLVGLATVSLEVPRSVTYGEQFTVSGSVKLNLTRPAPGVAVELRVGNSVTYVTTNASGGFRATLTAPFNSSGLVCVAASVAPAYAHVISAPVEGCSRLVYYVPNVSVSVTPGRQLPGEYVNVSVSVLGSCELVASRVYVMGQAYNLSLKGDGLAWGPVAIPPEAPTGPLPAKAYVNVTPPCVPTNVSFIIDVARLPSSLSLAAPPVWFGLLPLPVEVTFSTPSGPGPATLNLSVGTARAVGPLTGRSLVVAPYVSLLGGFVYVSGTAEPLNVTYSPASASARVYEVPGAIIAAPLAGLAGYAAGRRRRRAAPGGPSVSGGPAGPRDPLLIKAWETLEGLAARSGTAVLPSMTARDIAERVEKAMPSASGALREAVALLERLAYGGGLSDDGRARLEGIIRSLGEGGG